ncbi:hypothetical protein B2G74_00235 [Burkholderia sp. A27]|nr:hypothetical protein B2G74_00235 [Burkholderia sp. A27]
MDRYASGVTELASASVNIASANCGRQQLVLTTGHLLPSIVHNTLLLRIAVVECWLADCGTQGKD